MTAKTQVRSALVKDIRPNRRNPRKNFDQGALEELATSIREVGVIQPITVIPRGRGFTIVAGERRWRAAKIAGLERIPVVIRQLSQAEIAKVAFIENLQRRDLDPIEEAHAIDDLMKTLHVKVDEVAAILGKSVTFVYNRLRLLDLPEPIMDEIAGGRLSPIAGAILTRLEDPSDIEKVGLRVVREQMTIAQVEALVRDRLQGSVKAGRSQQRNESYNRKLLTLRTANGKQVVAYNEFDSAQHQRVWNLRFPECRGCPKKGVYLTRDMRQEDLCVDALCYRRLENRERSERLEVQARSQGELKSELEKILHRDDVEEAHLQLVAFTLLELLGSLADGWRTERGLPRASEPEAAAASWNWLSQAVMDDLVTAAIEFSVIYVAAGAGHTVRVPEEMVRDLSSSFSLDATVVSRVISSAGRAEELDEAVEAAASDIP